MLGCVAHWAHGASGSIHVDDSHYPVIITTWVGTPSPELAAAYAAFIQGPMSRAESEGTRLVGIHDTLHAEPPTPDMREAFTELGRTLGPRSKAMGMLTIIVLDRVVIRTAITAAVFLTNGRERTRVAPSMARGIDLALQTVESTGASRPAGLHPDAYRRPHLTAAAV